VTAIEQTARGLSMDFRQEPLSILPEQPGAIAKSAPGKHRTNMLDLQLYLGHIVSSGLREDQPEFSLQRPAILPGAVFELFNHDRIEVSY